MSDELDALAEAARNRGLKLVRSRVRSPGKRRFGKVGVTDKNGKPLFGMDDKGPIGKPEDAAEYLRNLGARDWGASLDVAVLPRKPAARRVEGKKAAKALRQPANDAEPAPKPAPPPVKPPRPVKPPPEPKPPEVRAAKPSDAARIAELVNLLQHEIDAKALAKNLNRLKKLGELPLVATLDKQVVGLCGVHKMTAIHRPAPVGRITILVVAEKARKRGIARLLVEAAEQWCRDHGCKLIEVTSNDRLAAAHAFYRHMGYDRTSIRFAKEL